MDETALLKLLGSGGFAAALVALFWVVGMRIVSALDRLGQKFGDHTEHDIKSHGEVKEELVRLGAKIDTVADRRWDELTPVQGVPTHYAKKRPRRKSDEE